MRRGHRRGWASGPRRGRGGNAAVLPAVGEVPVVGVDLGPVALLTGALVVPRAGLQTTLDVDETALLQVLATELGELAVALVPDHDVVKVGVLAALAALRVGPVAVGGHGELADTLSAGQVAQLGVAGEAADEHHAVGPAGHRLFLLIVGGAHGGVLGLVGVAGGGRGGVVQPRFSCVFCLPPSRLSSFCLYFSGSC